MKAYQQLMTLMNNAELIHPTGVADDEMLATTKYTKEYCQQVLQDVVFNQLPPLIDGGNF